MWRTVKFILNHPLTRKNPVAGILNFVSWQISSRINRRPVVYNFTSNSKLWVWKGLTGATGNIYCGLHEFEDMAFLLHFLRPDDLFVDVGANIGSYTMLASAEIGAKTIAIEPVLQTFQHLTKNIQLNSINNKAKALNMGVGSGKGLLKFTNNYDTGNHVTTDDSADCILVNVDKLDTILANEMPSILKIDVEGFETEVIKGADNVLKLESLKAIIIELNGAGTKYGFNDTDIHNQLVKSGFKSVKYAPYTRELTNATRGTEHNTLYIRDEDFVKKRVKEGRTISVQNKNI